MEAARREGVLGRLERLVHQNLSPAQGEVFRKSIWPQRTIDAHDLGLSNLLTEWSRTPPYIMAIRAPRVRTCIGGMLILIWQIGLHFR